MLCSFPTIPAFLVFQALYKLPKIILQSPYIFLLKIHYSVLYYSTFPESLTILPSDISITLSAAEATLIS